MCVHVYHQFSCSVVSDSLRPMECSTPGFSVHTNSQSLLKLMSIESVMPSKHLILCCLLVLLRSMLSSIRIFSKGLALLIRWPKYWSFSINPSKEYSAQSLKLYYFNEHKAFQDLDLPYFNDLLHC